MIMEALICTRLLHISTHHESKHLKTAGSYLHSSLIDGGVLSRCTRHQTSSVILYDLILFPPLPHRSLVRTEVIRPALFVLRDRLITTN